MADPRAATRVGMGNGAADNNPAWLSLRRDNVEAKEIATSSLGISLSTARRKESVSRWMVLAMAAPLSPDVLTALSRYNSPTIANAIELFNVRPRDVGFLPHAVRSLTPDLGVMVGYAVTSQTKAVPPTFTTTSEAPSASAT